MRWAWNALRRWWNPGGEATVVQELSRGQAARLPSYGEGASLRLRKGVVVVTREGDARDHVLEAGSELQLPGSGRAVAWAIESSRFEIRRRTEPLADWGAAVVRRSSLAERSETPAGRSSTGDGGRQRAHHRAPPPSRAGEPARPSMGGGVDPG